MKNWKTVLLPSAVVLTIGMAAAWAAQTNYIGTVFIADTTTPANQLTVNADGSINATVISGGGVPSIAGTANQITETGSPGATTLSIPSDFRAPGTVLATTSLTTPLLNLSGTSNQLVFQSAGVTGTLSWAPASTNKTITLPNGTTDFTGTGGTGQVLRQSSSGAAITVATMACSDLSNGATGCSTATGTSGATIPLLNGTNTWSGTNTFNAAIGIGADVTFASGASHQILQDTSGYIRLGTIGLTSIYFQTNSSDKFYIDGGAPLFAAASTAKIGWSSTTAPDGGIDTNLSRSAAGVIQVGTTTANNSGTLDAALYKAGGTSGIASCTVATLGATITIKGGIITAFTGC